MQIIPGTEYKIAGAAAFEHEGKVQNGVYVDMDGTAWAGCVTSDVRGYQYFDMAFDWDDQRLEAFPGWDACIVGVVAPVTARKAA